MTASDHTEEEQVGSRVTDELDEWFLDEFPFLSGGCDHVEHRVDRELHGDFQRLDNLPDGRAAPETGQALIPNSSEQLLDVWVGHELHINTKRP